MSKWEGRGVVTGGRHDRGRGVLWGGGGGGYVVMSVCLCVGGGGA